jgi:hypothetical protein
LAVIVREIRESAFYQLNRASTDLTVLCRGTGVSVGVLAEAIQTVKDKGTWMALDSIDAVVTTARQSRGGWIDRTGKSTTRYDQSKMDGKLFFNGLSRVTNRMTLAYLALKRENKSLHYIRTHLLNILNEERKYGTPEVQSALRRIARQIERELSFGDE